MLGFVLPTVAIHHLRRNRRRERRRRGALLSTYTHTHTFPCNPPPPAPPPPSFSLLRHPVFATARPASFLSVHTCVVKLSLLFFTYSALHSGGELPLWGPRERTGEEVCAAALFRKRLAHKDETSPSPINPLLKGGCNLSSVNVLGVESILLGFPNLKKKGGGGRKNTHTHTHPLTSKHLIKAPVSLDHILQRSMGGWGWGAGGCKSLITPPSVWLKLIFN